MSSPKHPRNFYLPISHVSDVLWHFIGPKEWEYFDPSATILRLDSLISHDGLSLTVEPHTKSGNFYSRKMSFKNTTFGASGAMDDTVEYSVEEPKAICFCDITLPYLPLHMEKYGDVGFGIRRKNIDKSDSFNIRPVRYYPLTKTEQLDEENNILWKMVKKKVTLMPFTKIPTDLNDRRTAPAGDNAELFDTIYEEREWRTLERTTFGLTEIAYILIPSRKYLDRTRYKKLFKMIDNGVSLIIAEDLFRKKDDSMPPLGDIK